MSVPYGWRELSVADDALGAWMAAALDDPNVCAEMKRDINAWLGQYKLSPDHPLQSVVERSELWEVWQDDMAVAASDSLSDAEHYLMMYSQDGPAKLVHAITYRHAVSEAK